MNKTLFFLPDVVGGVSSVVTNILEFAPKEEETGIVVYSDSSIERKKMDVMGKASRFTRFSYHGRDNNYFTSRRLMELVPADATCLVATDNLELTMVQLLRLQKPVVFIVMGDFSYYYRIAQANEGIIDIFIAISGEIHTKLVELLPGRSRDIRLAYFPTPEVSVKRRDAGAGLRAEAGSTQGALRIIYVARLEAGKNPLILPRIDRVLREKGIRVEWTVVGDGPERKELEEGIGGAENFRLAGFLSSQDLSRQYAGHDIFLLPSRSEGLPISLIEAMKTGLAPVVSDIPGGIREIVKKDMNGFLCDPEDATAFATCLERLDRDRGLLERIAGEALRFADQHFDPARCCAHYWSIIDETVSSVKATKRYNPTKSGLLDRNWLPNKVVRWLRGVRPQALG